MRHYFLGPVRAIVCLLLMGLNVVCTTSVFFLTSFFYFIIPISFWRKYTRKLMHSIAKLWTDINNLIMKMLLPTKWEIHGLENLKHKDWYLIISNHQSWLDILVLQKIFNHKIPLLCFFMKKELKWQMPILAQACALLDYPFMKRYSKAFLAKNPHLKGKDIETTRKTCKKFKTMPISMINFVEGGRFSKEKHQSQKSPYQNLLKPKAGGIAFTLETMGDILQTLLNVSIVYPKACQGMWDYLCGRMHKIKVYVKAQPITKDILGDYQNDKEYRVYFQKWLNELWEEKDKFIGKIYQEIDAERLCLPTSK